MYIKQYLIYFFWWTGRWESGSRCDSMYTFASEKKKDRPESIVIARVKAIIVTILGINPPLFETDARPFLARSLA